MLLLDDKDRIRRLLGIRQVPADIEAEYEKWIVMFHSSGGSGPLGLHMLIPMLRMLGYERKMAQRDERPEVIWQEVPLNTVLVLTESNGGERLAMYRGQVGPGTIGVLFEGETYVREVTARDARLWDGGVPDGVVLTEHDVVATPEPLVDASGAIRWESLPEGTSVMVDNAGEPVDATYAGLSRKDTKVRVKIQDRVREVEKDSVILAVV